MRYPPPGRLIDVGTHRLHLRCEGDGTPSVIFDAALGASSLSWSLVQPAVARCTRTCAYDRAGFGWSAPGPLPRTAGRLADELHELLTRAVPPPYLLVGHSFGGLVTRIFASRHAEEIAGLVFIEPAVPEQWVAPTSEQRALIDRGARLCGYGVTAARLGIARAVSALVRIGALAPARALVKVVSRGGLRREDEGILAPIWKLPPESRRVLREAWTQPHFFEALGSQIERICESAHEAARAPVQWTDVPLVVMSSAGASQQRLAADAALARLSARGRHVLVADSGHWIPIDAPQAVIDAVAAMVREIRLTATPPTAEPPAASACPDR
jgi:pimeloyl-ACP methyl ester carboxylesterase